jgi:hypothetical protein
MTYPEKAAINEHVTGGSRLASSSEANRVPDGERSASDERRLQNALEDDEVREALQVLRGTKPAARNRKRPAPLAEGSEMGDDSFAYRYV